MKIRVIIIAVLGLYQHAISQNSAIDWSAFLSRNDLIFDTLTTKWEEGLFTGNGLLGAMVYMADSETLRIDVGRSDVVDHRSDTRSPLYEKARLPLGYFTLKLQGKIKKNTARLHLWNAEATGVVVTNKGTIRWRCITLSEPNLILFQVKNDGAEEPVWSYVPVRSISERSVFSYVTDVPKNYKANPPSQQANNNRISYSIQSMLAGGDYTTAWMKQHEKGFENYFISVGYNTRRSSAGETIKTLAAVSRNNTERFIARHRNWWHQYYPLSFISLPDARTESFYWIQQYKLASATRKGKPPLDLMGPWYFKTPWPAYWFNLNIQLTYSPLYTANRLSIAEGLVDMIDAGKENLSRNVPLAYRHNALALGRSGGRDLYRPVQISSAADSTATSSDLELGNLTWCLYYYWLHYRYTMSVPLKNSLLPLLKGSINYYLNIMYKEADGKWHLPYTYSPEYPQGITRDCNYDIALFKWGCKTLLQLAPTDSLAPVWQDILSNLVNYPQDGNGLRIGRDMPFNQSHRHYSHLLMIYPLSLINWAQPENRALIKKSLEHWHSFKGALQGYSFTGGAAIYASMNRGDMALNYLNQLFDRYVKPNTMYMESGPVIETPLAAAETIHTLLLQYVEGVIQLFPALPNDWSDVSFAQLRTEGAFLISAVRREGITKWVQVESVEGGTCILQPAMKGHIKVKGNKAIINAMEGNRYRLTMNKGDKVILYIHEDDLNEKIKPVNQGGSQHYWGRKTR